jgi:Ca-activated chloride channel family protein
MSRSQCAGIYLCWLSIGVFLTGCGSSVESTSAPQASPYPAADVQHEFSQRYSSAEKSIAPATSAASSTLAPPSPDAPSVVVIREPAAQAVEGNVRYTVPANPSPALEPTEPAQTKAADGVGPGQSGDKYAHMMENGFLAARDQPLSTFSIDVDTASYSKSRMYLLQQHSLPPIDAVRIEEFLNYFEYDYSPPTNGEPFAIHLEVAECPWQPAHQIARVAIKGREIHRDRPPCNLVFLIDVSGSMASAQKIGLVKQSLRMLASQLSAQDSVAMVTYSNRIGLHLPATEGDRHAEIFNALDRLEVGGSTNGGAGIQLAYSVAKKQRLEEGVNRVILCTDGDFNVGTTSTSELVRLAATEAKAGVFLTVLGFGMGNHNDAMLEEVSNKANGSYAFIDNDAEASKVMIDQIDSTLVTIAKDVKIQVEFNPAQVSAYRLIGYENRLLQAHDFNDDRKDAGEVGAGHTITALYELVPTAADGNLATPRIDPLKYQPGQPPALPSDSSDLFTLKLRYKEPDGDRSQLVTRAVSRSDTRFSHASADFRFAASVAAFGMILRKSELRGDVNLDAVLEMASAARGNDRRGYREEFLQLVQTARNLSPNDRTSARVWSPPTNLPVVRVTTLHPHFSASRSGDFSTSLINGLAVFFAFNFLAAVLTVTIVVICVRRSSRSLAS